jgi:hypothetical protein
VSLVVSTEQAVAAATHLGPMDAGSVEAMRLLARKIDAWDRIVEWALIDAEENGSRPMVPANDNVSLSAYLKYCDQLGLTPAGRKALMLKREGESAKAAKLTALRSPGARAAKGVHTAAS